MIQTFLIEDECKTPIGCLTFIFYQKFFFGVHFIKKKKKKKKKKMVQNECKTPIGRLRGVVGHVAWWLATSARKPKVTGSSPAASYVQR